MPKQAIAHPDSTNTDGPFSAAIVCDGWLYISGQGPLHIKGDKVEVFRGTIQEETALTLSHIDKLLKEAGCTREDVVKCTCHLSDIQDFAGFNEAYKAYFANKPRPARTTVESKLWSNIKVEIDAIARIPAK